jgi:hypothetical protein
MRGKLPDKLGLRIHSLGQVLPLANDSIPLPRC